MNSRRSARSAGRVLIALVLGAVIAGDARANPQVYRRLLRSTGWVVVPSRGGITAGTCFVVDGERHLVLTCRHVVGESSEALVYFPRDRDGEPLVDAEDYLTGVTARRGRVVARDGGRDLALIRLDSLPDGVEALPLAKHSPEPGETVYSVGNSGLADGGVLWRYTRGDVRLVYSRRIKTPKGVVRVRTLETQSPLNKGDSGGPVVNARGELVGVAASYAADERLVSENTDVAEVRQFLRDAPARQEGGAAESSDSARPGAGPAPAAPGDEAFSVQGRWRVAVIKDGNQTSAGDAEFRGDGTFALKVEKAKEGRYACANGVLLLFHGDETALLPLTWADRGNFSVTSGKREWTFSRQRPAK